MASSWRVEFERGAEKTLDKLAPDVRGKLVRALDRLTKEMNAHGRPIQSKVMKLKGTADKFRLRVDDWRIVFKFQGDRLVVLVLDLGHRREIYRS
ncbi:Plasmid stabilization system protein [compost metagenome]